MGGMGGVRGGGEGRGRGGHVEFHGELLITRS